MPKEVILGRDFRYLDENGVEILDLRKSQVEVGWQGEETGGNLLQVVSKCVNVDGSRIEGERPSFPSVQRLLDQLRAKHSGPTSSIPVELLAEAIEELQGGGLCTTESALAVTDGFYVDLDRRGVNDLIKALRRARDQAFGRDE